MCVFVWTPQRIVYILDVLMMYCCVIPIKVSMKEVTVSVGDHVVVIGLKTGHVMYVGHIDGASDKHCIFVGLELDAPGMKIQNPHALLSIDYIIVV